MCYTKRAIRGYSSVGRALEWHSRGQGFDSPYLHQTRRIRTLCVYVRIRSRFVGFFFIFGAFFGRSRRRRRVRYDIGKSKNIPVNKFTGELKKPHTLIEIADDGDMPF